MKNGFVWVATYRELQKDKLFRRLDLEQAHTHDAGQPGVEPDQSKLPTVWVVTAPVPEGQEYDDRNAARRACDDMLKTRFPGADIGGTS